MLCNEAATGLLRSYVPVRSGNYVDVFPGLEAVQLCEQLVHNALADSAATLCARAALAFVHVSVSVERDSQVWAIGERQSAMALTAAIVSAMPGAC